MNHLEYYRYYERTGNEDHGCCSDCKVTISDSNCNYDVTDEQTGEYVCVECMGEEVTQ